MGRFPYDRREREVRDAQEAVHAAARAARKYPNKDDAPKAHWKDEAARFHRVLRAAYPQSLLAALESLRRREGGDLEPVLEFLEADPIFYGSGYMKEEALRLLPRASLSEDAKNRLTAVLLNAVRGNGRREFRRYCLLGRHINSEDLRSALEQLRHNPEAGVRRRAEWALDCLSKRD